MKFPTLEELKVRQWDVFGRLFESVRRQVGQNWPVQDFRGFIFSVPKTLPYNLILRGVIALSGRAPPGRGDWYPYALRGRPPLGWKPLIHGQPRALDGINIPFSTHSAPH